MTRTEIQHYAEALGLEHYGVLGMKWGRRKSRSGDSLRSKVEKASEEHVRAKALRKKKIREMSNDELAFLTRRIGLEQSYSKLTAKKKSFGRKLVESILQEQGKKLLAVGVGVAETKLKEAFAKRAGDAVKKAASSATNKVVKRKIGF